MSAIHRLVLGSLVVLLGLGLADAAPSSFVQFNGTSAYVEVANSADFSVATTGSLSVSAWMRPDTLTFPNTEGSGYVHWLGIGTAGEHEWVLRMYSQDNQENRANRISFYVFNPQGGLGIGSYFEDPVIPGEWIHVVGVVDGRRTRIYRNGVQRDCDQYTGNDDSKCHHYASNLWITPKHGNAPLRLGTRDLHSYFQGALAQVRIWNRALSADEIAGLYQQDMTPRNGLVAEYLFTDGSGPIAHDTAGSHDGTLFGATWSITPPVSLPAETLTGAGLPITFAPGQPFTETLATFTDTDPTVTPDLLQVSVEWGDGTETDLTSGVLAGGNGSFQVSGGHQFADAGPYTVQVTLTNLATQAQGSAQSPAGP
jgi:hypothetical protein